MLGFMLTTCIPTLNVHGKLHIFLYIIFCASNQHYIEDIYLESWYVFVSDIFGKCDSTSFKVYILVFTNASCDIHV